MADRLVALSALWTITAVHVAGGAGRATQRLLSTMTVLAIGGFIVAGFLFGHGAWANFRSSTVPHGSSAIALIFVLFAYSGWNSSAYLASEMRDPERDLPRSLLIGTGVVMVLYLGINALYVYALPIAAMSGVLPVTNKPHNTCW